MTQTTSHQTLLEACHTAGIPGPVSEDQLHEVFRCLKARGIHHNLEDEPCYQRWAAQQALIADIR